MPLRLNAGEMAGKCGECGNWGERVLLPQGTALAECGKVARVARFSIFS